MTHAEAGGILAEHWKLPDVLRVAIEHRHGAQGVEDFMCRKVCEVVALAGRCADVFVGDTPAESISGVRRAFLENYQIREIECDSLLCDVGQKTSELAPLFEVKINSSVNYEQIVAKASERLLELSLAEQADGSAAQTNRRRAARIRRDGSLFLMPCKQGILGQPVQVRLKDLSAGGIGLIHTLPMEKGSQFVVQLPQPGGQTKSLLYTVVRCESPGAGGPYSVGAELACVLKADATSKPDPSRAPDRAKARALK